ncbi:hypothetical protein LCGC14_1518180 [marine sediment metagenome]|uniref:AraC family transcriptional regulator n=2 Tax=root TaxID=1 RepID=A0A831VTV2_9GAMM|nr:AraC family transcriptional regulator [Marinobacter antarcticus]HEA51103.1 AraC family transcriptional regulator [Marinobacter antarcticus]
MFSQSLATSTIFHGAHPEEVSAFVNQHIGGHSLDLLGGENLAASLSFGEFAGFGLSRISYGNHVRVKSPALDDIYHFQVVTRGECRWRHGGENLRVRRGQAMMVNPDEVIDLEYTQECEKVIIKVPASIMKSVSSTGSSAREQVVRFDRLPIDMRLCPSLMSILDAVFSEFEESGDSNLGAVTLPYREIVLKKLLKVFPNNWNASDSVQPVSPSMERIIRYIEENVKEDIELETLSQISNMSIRSIYNAFSRVFSTTPKSYVKLVKLKRLRNDLLHGHCRNVTEVALDYGFSHLGRFSSDYRKRFGELPSETMRLAG